MMTMDQRTRRQILGYCLEIHDDDGDAARRSLRKKAVRKKVNHKVQQLCRQAWETLALAMAEDSGNDDLVHIQIVTVEPAPDASRLRVVVTADNILEPEARRELELRLQSHAGRLRCAVAAAITRRKAPALVFHWQLPERSEEGHV